jgi:hypothetical protein
VTVRTTLTIGAVVLATIVGYVIGARQAPPPPLFERGGTLAIASLDAPTVRSIVREEIARGSLTARACPSLTTSGTAMAPAAPAAPERENEAPLDRETQAAVARAHDIINRALENGTWSESDRTALRNTLAQLPPGALNEIHSQLFPALNDGRLKPTFTGVPL